MHLVLSSADFAGHAAPHASVKRFQAEGTTQCLAKLSKLYFEVAELHSLEVILKVKRVESEVTPAVLPHYLTEAIQIT